MVEQIQVTGIRELTRKFTNLQKVLPGQVDRAIKDTLVKGKRMAQYLAPSKSGTLKRGITYRTDSKNSSGELTSTVPGDFPYNLWVNRTIPFINMKTKSRFFLTKGRKRYGDGRLKAPSGKNINWTGVPGYFDITIKMMKKKFPKSIVEAVGKSLKRSGFKGGKI